MEKICTNCLTEQSESEFFFKNKKTGKRHAICKSCKREIDREAYNKGGTRRDKIRKNAKASVQRAHDYVQIIKEINPCKNCGESRPYVLDFHHENGIKEKNISVMVRQGCSLTKIQNEILKCRILCANCHREVHHQELEKKLTG